MDERAKFATTFAIAAVAFAHPFVYASVMELEAFADSDARCVGCGLGALVSLVCVIASTVLAWRDGPRKNFLRVLYTGSAVWCWFVYGLAGFLLSVPPTDAASSIGTGFAILGMYFGLITSAPLFLFSGWLIHRRWHQFAPVRA